MVKQKADMKPTPRSREKQKQKSHSLPNRDAMILSLARTALRHVYHRYPKDPDVHVVLSLARKSLKAADQAPTVDTIDRKSRTVLGISGEES